MTIYRLNTTKYVNKKCQRKIFLNASISSKTLVPFFDLPPDLITFFFIKNMHNLFFYQPVVINLFLMKWILTS